MWHLWEREEVSTGFWLLRNLKEDLGVDGRIILKRILKK
jgi:hypothetical protein